MKYLSAPHFLRAAAFAMLIASGLAVAEPLPADCRVGSYRLSRGTVVDIAPVDGTSLRWRFNDGTTGALKPKPDGVWISTLGWTGRPDGNTASFPDCATGEIIFNNERGRRLAFDTLETRFQGAGITLAGRLILPKGRQQVPIVVLVHGAEHSSARDFYTLQRQFASEGIGVFVYDKRGTGASDGLYSQNYLVLANDLIAATHEARRLAGERAGRIGYQAGSQGGWVAPLAARIEPVDFVVVSFGLAVSPLDEDREAIVLDLSRRGFGPKEVAKAMEIADASARVLLSNFQDGYEGLAAVRQKYQAEPWFRYVRGNATSVVLETPPAQLRQAGPPMIAGAPLQYDPMPVLRNLETPQLWILGEDDIDAPIVETLRRLKGLVTTGRPITVAVFPAAEHGIYQYETQADGTRLSTRNPDGYFQIMRDFIRGDRLDPPYGSSLMPGRSSDQ